VRIIPNEPIIPDVVTKAAGLTLVDSRKCYAHSSRAARCGIMIGVSTRYWFFYY